MPPRRSYWQELLTIFKDKLKEFVSLVLTLASLEGGRKIVEWSVGNEKFFDWIPIRYAFDLADLVPLGWFIYRLFVKSNR